MQPVIASASRATLRMGATCRGTGAGSTAAGCAAPRLLVRSLRQEARVDEQLRLVPIRRARQRALALLGLCLGLAAVGALATAFGVRHPLTPAPVESSQFITWMG